MSKDKITSTKEARKFMALAGIKEDDKKFLNNESYKILKESMGDITPEEWAQMHPEKTKSDTKSDDGFIIVEFDQVKVEPGKEDETLYKLD